MPKIIILDFDHTLFNAQLFKKDLAEALGLSLAIWEKEYQKNKKKYHNYNYQKQITNYPAKNQKKFLNVLKNSKKYLYPDAIYFLHSVETRHGVSLPKIILLSKGQPEFQKIKIKNCQLEKYLTIKTVAIAKINFIKTLRQAQGKNKKNIIFINDRGKEIDEIKKIFPQITAIWIRRANGQYKNEPCKTFDKKYSNLKIKL